MLATTTNRNNRRNRRAAFTLMEILVVVAIMVVLAGVGIVSYMRIQEDAYRQTAKVKVKELEKAASAYMRAHENQPAATLQELATPSDGGQGYVNVNELTDPWGQLFIYQVLDPTTAAQNGLQVPVLVYSIGPNRIDDGGSGDDITNR